MVSWKDIFMQQERYADFRREAERDRLVQMAQAQQGQSSRIRAWILYRLQSLVASLRSGPSVPASAEKDAGTRSAQSEDRGQAHRHVSDGSNG
jgi:hypothetical protein